MGTSVCNPKVLRRCDLPQRGSRAAGGGRPSLGAARWGGAAQAGGTTRLL